MNINTEPVRFTLNQFLISASDSFHLARTVIHSGKDLKYHSHDYAEVFWIEDGQGIHYINNQAIKVMPGYLCMIRPSDAHTFEAKPLRKGLVVTNLAFKTETLDFLKMRYFKDSQTYFWQPEELPYSCNLNRESQVLLNQRTDKALTIVRNNFYLDKLLHFIFELAGTITSTEQNPMPYWLQCALLIFNQPTKLKSGMNGFAQITGKSKYYINRVLKQSTGKTLTETINQLRLQYATHQLTMTEDSIKSIASDCGINHIGYFYRLFQAYTTMTPRQYRELHKRII